MKLNTEDFIQMSMTGQIGILRDSFIVHWNNSVVWVVPWDKPLAGIVEKNLPNKETALWLLLLTFIYCSLL